MKCSPLAHTLFAAFTLAAVPVLAQTPVTSARIKDLPVATKLATGDFLVGDIVIGGVPTTQRVPFTLLPVNSGPAGPAGATGATGATGAAGVSPSLSIGAVGTLPAGSAATVTLSGTTSNPMFNFGLPAGATGSAGATGPAGSTGATGAAGAIGPAGPAPTTAANQVLAGPATGGAAALAAPRALVAADLPSLPYVGISDARLSDARTPSAHASSHAGGGSDPLTPASIGAAALSIVQTVGNADATINAGTDLVRITAALTAARTYTLPAASAKAAIRFEDEGNYTFNFAASVVPAGADNLNGGTSAVALLNGYGHVTVVSDGASKWEAGQSLLAAPQAMNVAAGGTNQNVNLLPSGTGAVGIGVQTTAITAKLDRITLNGSTYVVMNAGGAQIGYFRTGLGLVLSSGMRLDFLADNVSDIGTSATRARTIYVGTAIRANAVPFAFATAGPTEGTVQAFTDSTTNTWGATITGGGTNHVLGYYDGTNWTVAAK